MTKMQIRLLYTTYGWSIADIAKFLELPESGVKMYLEQDALLLPAPCPAELAPYSDTPPQADAYASGIRDLKKSALTKELSVAPILAAIELSLLHKLMEAVKALDSGNINQLTALVDTFKKLTKDSLTTAVVQAEEKQTQAAVQVVVPVMVFKD